jgi:predicted aminopeptidase
VIRFLHPPRWTWTLFFVGLGVVALIASACSPMYVIKAGIAEAKILRARQPLHEVILDPATDERTKAKLTFVVEARTFAIDGLGLDVGDSYTSFAQLDQDTLALVLSAATRDRFASKTWWFPVVGRVPYKGYFDEDDALKDQQVLEDEGLDTYLRPTAAFSTLGWFSDPLLSTLLRRDEVDLVETVIHELSHNHLFVRGSVGFNESFATFVGRVGAIEFFCTRQGGGPDTVTCLRAQERWRDYQIFSTFIDDLVDRLQAIYSDTTLSYDQKLEQRRVLFESRLDDFEARVQPSFEAMTFQSFLVTPLNNATLMARMRYYHRLTDFQALLDEHGGLRAAIEHLVVGVGNVEDPYNLLPVPVSTEPNGP